MEGDCSVMESGIFKEILVQDHFYRKYSLNHKLFELDTLCLPLLMMNNGAIAMVADSEQRLSVRLCVESDSSLQHTPFLNVACPSSSGQWVGRISMIAPWALYSSRLCLS